MESSKKAQQMINTIRAIYRQARAEYRTHAWILEELQASIYSDPAWTGKASKWARLTGYERGLVTGTNQECLRRIHDEQVIWGFMVGRPLPVLKYNDLTMEERQIVHTRSDEVSAHFWLDPAGNVTAHPFNPKPGVPSATCSA